MMFLSAANIDIKERCKSLGMFAKTDGFVMTFHYQLSITWPSLCSAKIWVRAKMVQCTRQVDLCLGTEESQPWGGGQSGD
jgi:hypothetical protein